MNVTETTNEGLRRELKVVIGADELEQKLDKRLDELQGKVQLKGFRPGHVPKSHLRKVYGRSVMAEVVQQVVTEASQKALADREEQPAYQPKIALPEDETEINKIFEGDADLAYTMSFEIIPDFEPMDFSKLSLERPVAEVSDKDVEEALDRLRKQNVNYVAKDGKAEEGDQVTIDFVGKKDGEPFEGGKAEGAPLVLGSNRFIPGFEEGLIGTKAGDEKNVEVTFPEDYPEKSLAGQPVVFEVKVQEVGKPEEPKLDDEFAKGLGLESLDKLKEMMKARLDEDRKSASRMKLKRQMLDKLNEAHDFALPEELVENEFKAIWDQVTHDIEHHGKSFEAEGTTEEKAKEEYRALAERRVRLGLLLSEVGSKNDVQVTDDEVNQALLERIRQFPGQERQVYEYYRNNPQALNEIRAPLYEDKVIDYIAELAKVKDKKVSAEELYEGMEGGMAPHSHDHDHDHDHDHHHDH